MKNLIIILVIIGAILLALTVGSGLISKIQHEEGMSGDTIAQGEDIQQLNKVVDAQKEQDYQDRRHQEDYERLDSSSASSQMDVPEFREEVTAPSTVSSLKKSLSQWQSWCMLGLIIVVGWVVWRRMNPPKG